MENPDEVIDLMNVYNAFPISEVNRSCKGQRRLLQKAGQSGSICSVPCYKQTSSML